MSAPNTNEQANVVPAETTNKSEEEQLPVFRDALFRQKRKHGKFRLVEPPRLEAAVVDSHAHFQMLQNPTLAIARAGIWGVSFICNIVDVAEDYNFTFGCLGEWTHGARNALDELCTTSKQLLECDFTQGITRLPAKSDPISFALPAYSNVRDIKLPHLRVATGVHPHNAKFYNTELEERLLKHLANPYVCAVGEVGLDYHYDLSPRNVQRSVFRRQIQLAHETGLPIALHVRDAHDDAFDILMQEGIPGAGCLLHCFDLGYDVLKPWAEAGCFVALGGAFTFSRCANTREAVKNVPRNRLLTETDAPFMTPEPMRGMECESAHTIFTAAALAEVLGVEAGQERKAFLSELSTNAYNLLDRKPTAWQEQHFKSE